MKTIHVATSPAYNVMIGSGLLDSCGMQLLDLLQPCRIAIVTDTTVAPLYLQRVQRSLERAGFTVVSCVFPAGEANKNFDTLSTLLESMAQAHLTRCDCVLALGGGVTGDMAGFAAGCFMRGIRCVQMPTTLLSAVDSSVGGKTAIDLKAGKNLAGVFLQPSAVLCDVDCLTTLPPEVFADGAAEAIKTGVLCDESLFSLFESGTLTTDPAEVIARCVAYKAGVVERDERETGERKLLNLGHTVGHAIEACSGYTIPHGHAVAAGLAIIARAAQRLGWTEEPIARRICACLTSCGLPVTTRYSAEELTQAALFDKKRTGSSITLIIPLRIGHCKLRKTDVSELQGIIAAGLEA